MSTREEIEKITGPKGIYGIVGWHVPLEINKIPDQVVRTYSPPVMRSADLSTVDKAKSCGVRLDPVQLADGRWVGKFTELTGPWDKGTVVLMKKLELEYSPLGPSLVQTNILVDDTWKLAEYRVHLTCAPRSLRDVLIWESRKPPIHQYVTSYIWCE
jgi:hypothetical protein